MIYKLKVLKDRIEIVDVLDHEPKEVDNEHIYATEEEIKMLNPKAITSFIDGLDTTVFKM